MKMLEFQWWQRHFLIITCMLFFGLALFLLTMIGLRLWLLSPTFDWGSAGMLDAVRLLRGMPVYEDWYTGHPTWLYGPGFIWILAAVFAVTGPSLGVAVAVSLLASAASIALCTIILKSRLSGWWLCAATLSFVLIEGQVMLFGTVSPDSFMLLFAMCGLCLCFRGDVWSMTFGGLLIVAATLMKQTMLASSIVPLFALALEGKKPAVKSIFIALIPPAMIAIVFLVLKTDKLWWFYIVEVSSKYSNDINYRDFVFAVIGHFIIAIPLWISAIFLLWLKIDQPPGWWRLFRWSLAASLVSTLVGALAASKFGGGANSLMPPWFALVLLCWVVMIPVLDASSTWSRGWIIQFGLLVSLLLFLLPRTSQVTWPIDFVLNGNRESYLAVSQRVRTLPGTVMSPGDVLLTFRERGQLDRSIWFDLDILKWPANLPTALLQSRYSATHIVINDPRQVDYMRLRERGYVETWEDGRYRIWSRTGVGTR